LFFACNSAQVEDAAAAAAPTRLQQQLRRTRIALARSRPTKAGAKRGFCPQKPSGAREIREPPKRRCLLINKLWWVKIPLERIGKPTAN